jgi:ribonuclease P protein component
VQKVGRSLRRNTTRAVTTTTESNKSSHNNNGYRLTKNKRLLDAHSYGRVFKQAKRSRDKMFTVLSRNNGGGETPSGEARLGLAISKKHCKLAVSRNRIKRLVRESFRHRQVQLRGLDVVVLNQPGTHRASNSDLLRSLEGHWQQCSSDNGAQREQG